MITMMMSIIPSDMALSTKRGRRMEIRHPAVREKHIPAPGSSAGTGALLFSSLPGLTRQSIPFASFSGGLMDGGLNPGHDGRAYRRTPRHPSQRFLLFRLQLQRCRIDAVAQAGGAGAVVEDVAEMAVALRAQHFGADHAVADVALFVNVVLRRRLGKARPAAAGIEFGIRFEQRLSAAGADIGAGPPFMLVFAGERPLGRLLAQHRVLHRRQFLPPLGLVLLDLAGRRLDVGHGVSLTRREALSW